MSKVSRRSKVKVTVVKDDTIFMGLRRVVPYPEIVTSLKKDGMVFVEGLSRQTAHYASKSLGKKMKKKVKHGTAAYKGIKGYVFYVEGK